MCQNLQLSKGREEDAHEFLRYTVDAMESICLAEHGMFSDPSEAYTNLMGLTFGGYLQSKIGCSKGQGKTEWLERMMDLTVEIEGSVESLEEALQRFTVYETLDGENKYKCIRCGSYEKTIKKLTVLGAPYVLTIALKRFQQHRNTDNNSSSNNNNNNNNTSNNSNNRNNNWNHNNNNNNNRNSSVNNTNNNTSSSSSNRNTNTNSNRNTNTNTKNNNNTSNNSSVATTTTTTTTTTVIDPPQLQQYCDCVVDGIAAVFLALKRKHVMLYQRTSNIAKRIAQFWYQDPSLVLFSPMSCLLEVVFHYHENYVFVCKQLVSEQYCWIVQVLTVYATGLYVIAFV